MFKLDAEMLFSIVSGVMIEEVVFSKSVSNRAKISKTTYRNNFHQPATCHI